MNLMAKQEVKKLLSQTGHHLTVDDFDLLSTIHEAGERVSNPSGDGRKFPQPPVRLGCYLLCPPTIAITLWYNECALPWWEDSNYADLAIGYALQPQIDGEWLWEQSKKGMEKILNSFGKSLNCTPDEYQEAIKEVLGVVDEDSDSDKSNDDYGPMISMLCKEYSQSPDYWLSEASVDTIQSLVNSHMEALQAEYNSIQKASKGASLPPFKTPKMAALENFRKKLQELEEAWQAKS